MQSNTIHSLLMHTAINPASELLVHVIKQSQRTSVTSRTLRTSMMVAALLNNLSVAAARIVPLKPFILCSLEPVATFSPHKLHTQNTPVVKFTEAECVHARKGLFIALPPASHSG